MDVDGSFELESSFELDVEGSFEMDAWIRVVLSSFAESSFADLGLIFVGFGSIC